MELLDSPHQALRTDAMWIVSSLTAGETEDTCHVLHAGALEPIFRLLESPSEAAREQVGGLEILCGKSISLDPQFFLLYSHQAVWAIANIAGDSKCLVWRLRGPVRIALTPTNPRTMAGPETRRAVLAVGGIPAIANVIAREAIPVRHWRGGRMRLVPIRL